MRKHKSKVQMDNKYRICLGSFLSDEEREQLSSFKISRQKDGTILLDPLVEVPAREHWIYKKPEALASLMLGMEDAENGRLVDVEMDFTEFLNEEEKQNVQD